MPETTLSLRDVWAGYGDALVLEGISLELRAGEVLAVLGPNGAGKSTLLATVMGLTHLQRGTIALGARDISRRASYSRARLGLAWVPQEREIFPSLSVEENLLAVARPGPWTLQRVGELFPVLGRRRRAAGVQLSGGEQQQLAIARALVANPAILLLDEPLEGLAPLAARGLLELVSQVLAPAGLAVLIVEHDTRLVASHVHRTVHLDRGRLTAARG